jgi:hypothetical protein
MNTHLHYVDEEGNVSKPLCTEIYNRNMSFVDTSDTKANQWLHYYSQNLDMDKKLFFHFISLTIPNAIIIHGSCDSTLTHKVFWKWLVGDLIQAAQDISPSPSASSRGRPTSEVLHKAFKSLAYQMLPNVALIKAKSQNKVTSVKSVMLISLVIHVWKSII